MVCMILSAVLATCLPQLCPVEPCLKVLFQNPAAVSASRCNCASWIVKSQLSLLSPRHLDWPPRALPRAHRCVPTVLAQ